MAGFRSLLLREVLADAPVGYWPMRESEANGTTMLDRSGWNRHGTYSGVTLARHRWRAQRQAIVLAAAPDVGDGPAHPAFNGTSSYARIPDNAAFSAGGGTLTTEIWALPAGAPVGSGGSAVMMAKHFGGGVEWIFGRSDGGFYGYTAANPFAVIVSLGGGVALPAGGWQHLVYVYNRAGGANASRFYVNGGLASSGGHSGTEWDSSAPVWIGRDNTGNYFRGGLAHAAIYDQALTAERVRAHYLAGRAEQRGAALPRLVA